MSEQADAVPPAERTAWYKRWWVWLAVVIVVAVCATGGVIAHNRVEAHNRDVAAQVAAAKAKAKKKAFADAVLKRVYSACVAETQSDALMHDTLTLADSDRTLVLESPSTATNTYETYHCIADQSSMPEAVQNKIGQTSGFSGMQSDSWANLTATWSYSSSNGLNLTLERK